MSGAPPLVRSSSGNGSSSRELRGGTVGVGDPAAAATPPLPALLRAISVAGKAGCITTEEKAALKDDLLAGNSGRVAAVLR